MQPVILHLDMNSYFASVEQQDRPEWRGRPLGVCEHLGGIIIAASIEAKKLGIKTGTPVWEARRLYPKIILTHTRPEAYRRYSRKFLKIVGDYTDKVEQYSIDECFFDVTRQCNITKENGPVDPLAEAADMALEIKRRFKTEVGDFLTCSIGIADNKILAKIASDLKKPDGLTVITERPASLDVAENPAAWVLRKEELYGRLKLTDVPGIGRRQEQNLNRLGIKTLADLRDCPPSWLTARFGTIGGYHLHQLGQLRASWKPEVRQEKDIKSMGHMYTLPREYRQPEFFLPVLYKLCEMVGRRLRCKKLEGNTVSFYCSFGRRQYAGKSRHLKFFIAGGREIFLQAKAIHAELAGDFNYVWPQIKLIGVTVSGLRPYLGQLSLFDGAQRAARLDEALDRINQKYGDFTVCRAPVISAGKVFRDSIGFGRIKEV